MSSTSGVKKIKDPFKYKMGDMSLHRENAPQYYPPRKRKEFRDYLSRSSVRFQQMVLPCDIPDYSNDQIDQYNPSKELNDTINYLNNKPKQQAFSVNRQKIMAKAAKSVSMDRAQHRRPSNGIKPKATQNWWADQETVSHLMLTNLENFNSNAVKQQHHQQKQFSKNFSKAIRKVSFRVGYEGAPDYQTTKTKLHDMPMKEGFSDCVPVIEEKRNRKNDSNVVLALTKKVIGSDTFIKEAYNTYKSVDTTQARIDQKEKYQEILDQSQHNKFQELISKARETLNKRFLLKDSSQEQAIEYVKQGLSAKEQRFQQRNHSSVFNSCHDPNPDSIQIASPSKTVASTAVLNNLYHRSSSLSQQQPLNNDEVNLDHYHTFYLQSLRDHELHQKLKSQNFHISGPNHKPINEQISNIQKQQNAYGSKLKNSVQERPQSSSGAKSNQYRTSFQDTYFKKTLDKQFHKDVKDVYDFMKKRNISFNHPLSDLHTISEQQQQLNSARVPDYNNINLINHLPFKDDQHTNNSRFNTHYRQLYFNRQDKESLMKNFTQNNDLNSFYMDRILKENHFLGKVTEQEHLDNLRSEKQVRYYRSKEQKSTIMQEILEGNGPHQLREEFKEKIERQNYHIKQPIISGGDKFFEDVEKRNYNLGSTQELMLNGNKTNELKFTLSASDFNHLNFRDKMDDQKKTNFHFGNHSITNENDQSKSIDITQDQIENGQVRKTQELPPQGQYSTFSPIKSRPIIASFTGSKGYQSNSNINSTQTTILSRPQTGQSNMHPSDARYITQDVHKSADRIKQQHQRSKVILGSDGRDHRIRTDYRNNFMWTVPKFAV
ncbi:UNKNOWN [Stylonychia lemnae]|uniref:Uncharacterized protein n=1 Tax=Stylonychia lemnae TaxID=5949 RepID=A0A077ZU03_STYLE|nr:UNKNOWN [Stylonychia lemnae]|eukprot:CDW73054.1 UNKNOWN [Stylonychia lemnae]